MSTDTKQARLTVEELHELKWFLGSFLALVALWSLWPINLGVGPVILLACSAIGVGILLPRRLAALPAVVWKLAPFAIVALIGIAVFLSAGGDFLVPLVHMIVLLLLYRVLVPRRRREDLQLVLICLFSLVVAGVLTVSLLFAFQILLFTPLAMLFLFLVCILDRGGDSREETASWKNFHFGRLVRRVWSALNLQVFGVSVVLFGFVVGLSMLVFVLIPRYNFNQAMPFLERTESARSGFTEEVGLGDVTSIKQDNSVALRVDVPSREAVPSMPYWRMLVLDEYTDGNFRMSGKLKSKANRNERRFHRLLGWRGVAPGIGDGTWTFYLEGGVSRYLPLPGPFRELRFQGRRKAAVLKDVGIIQMDAVKQNVFFYRIADLRWPDRMAASREEVNAYRQYEEARKDAGSSENADFEGGENEDSDRLKTLELPVSSEEENFLAELNSEITQGSEVKDVSEYGEAVESYLHENHYYSLSPGISEGAGDPVVEWLRGGEPGHCELYAGALVILAREAGYPARMVVGFAGGSWNAVESYWLVRNRSAHAWVELYDPEDQVWLRMDPTPGNGDGGATADESDEGFSERGWSAWFDSLRIQWYRRVVNFDEEDQLSMVNALGELWEQWKTSASDWVRDRVATVKEWLSQPLTIRSFAGAGVLVAVAGALYLLWWKRFEWLAFIRCRLFASDKIAPVRRQAGRYLVRLNEREAEADPERFSKERVDAVRRDLERLRYGPPVSLESGRAILVRAGRILRELRRW
ncbi:MAG: transglutaminaseTgpA domain-containing protein [Opitutales bacterium]